MNGKLLTARQLGEVIGLKPGTILDHWEHGKLPGYKFGRAVRFDLEEVLAAGRPGAEGEVSPTPYSRPAKGLLSQVSPTPHEGEVDA